MMYNPIVLYLPFNRTSMESKHREAIALEDEDATFNRTSMESKLTTWFEAW